METLLEERLSFLRWFGRSACLIDHAKKIYVDPWNLPEGLPQADIILITRDHPRHCSLPDVRKVARPDTIVAGHPNALRRFLYNQVPMNHHESCREDILGYKVETVRVCLKQEDGGELESPDRFGYIVEVEGLRLYHSGGTDAANALLDKFVDAALIPLEGADRIEAAAAVVELMRPKLALPLPYGPEEARGLERFAKLCARRGVAVRLPPAQEKISIADGMEASHA